MKTALRIASTADGGYVAGQRFYAYYPDFRGNVHVVASDGEFLQSNHYYPYGLPFAEGVAPKFQPHKYSGKEFLSDRSLNLYDFHARLQDPIIGGFDRMDNKAEDYAHASPYSYCLGNPIKFIDPTGEDVVILIKGIHMAMLIQNEEGKWEYFSINGNNLTSSGSHVGGRKFNDVAVGCWDSPEDFLNSPYNVRTNESKDDPSMNHYGYTVGYLIPTTPEQDKTMKNSFSEAAKTEYAFFSNNCVTTVQDVLISADIPVSEPEFVNSTMCVSTPFGLVEACTGVTKQYETTILSFIAYYNIRKYNPNGQLIHKSNKK